MSAPGTYAPAAISFADSGNELSSFNCFGALPTADNFDDITSAWDALLSSAQAIVLGATAKRRYIDEDVYDWSQPTNGAMRETKLLIQYKGTVLGKRFSCTLPTMNPSNTIVTYAQNINAKDVVLIPTTGALHTFLLAFAAFAKSPEDPTEAVAVIGLKMVGRNI